MSRKLSDGAKCLSDGLRMGSCNFQKRLGCSARVAGVLFPFVRRADARADKLGGSGLAGAHDAADGGGIWIAGFDQWRWRQFVFLDKVGHEVIRDILQLGNGFFRSIAMTAITRNRADGNLIFITPAHAERVFPREAGGNVGGYLSHDLAPLIFSAIRRYA